MDKRLVEFGEVVQKHKDTGHLMRITFWEAQCIEPDCPWKAYLFVASGNPFDLSVGGTFDYEVYGEEPRADKC